MYALLNAGANPNLHARVTELKERKNADHPTGGFTALMWAARNGSVDIVERLVAGGADLNARNGDGATAAMIAIVNPVSRSGHSLSNNLPDSCRYP